MTYENTPERPDAYNSASAPAWDEAAFRENWTDEQHAAADAADADPNPAGWLSAMDTTVPAEVSAHGGAAVADYIARVAGEDSVEEAAAHQAEIGFWDGHYDAALDEAEADGS